MLHLHCASDVKGKGRLDVEPEDHGNLSIHAVDLGRPFRKYSAPSRLRYELLYGRAAMRAIDAFSPDVVISGNTPLVSQRMIGVRSRKRGAAFIYWQQDVMSLGTQLVLARKSKLTSRSLGGLLRWLEVSTLRQSDAIVAISPDFVPILDQWQISRDLVTVIENWAPLDEMPLRTHVNPWSSRHGLDGTKNFIYAGTLGMKHNPKLLSQLAVRVKHLPDVRLVVVSEGIGASWLSTVKKEQGIENLVLLPYQRYEELPDVLGAADVLLTILEPDAGVFSVPSKILSYQCAGRAVLAAIPRENLGARVITGAGSGVVVDPKDENGFVEAALEMIADDDRLKKYGAMGRAYAERTFDVDAICSQFERVIHASLGRRHARDERALSPVGDTESPPALDANRN